MRNISIKKIASNIFLLAAALLLIYTIYVVVQSRRTGENIFIFGHRPYIIISESMSPGIQRHALIIVRQVDIDEVEEGDIISFQIPSNIYHRQTTRK
ncbi:MAG: S26 family signal peptidase [Oscillospiraceae bacterium]|nr:S26 family signal peptidase [Oscillospiraceae bacterium]